jgi:outer membrane immunogenic protein
MERAADDLTVEDACQIRRNSIFSIAVLWNISRDEGPDARALNYYSAFEIDWNAHIRARFGFLSGSTLLYVAGGLALAEVNVDDVDPGFGEDEARHVGWTVGVGVEHAMTKNLRARVEYLYDDYGSEDYAFTAFVPVLNYRANVDLTANTIRVGLAYQF